MGNKATTIIQEMQMVSKELTSMEEVQRKTEIRVLKNLP